MNPAFDIFGFFYRLFALPTIGAANAIAAALSGAVEPVLRGALVVLIIVSLFANALGSPGENALSKFIALIVKGAVAIYVMVAMSGYGLWARDVMLVSLPGELSSIIARALGAVTLEVSAFQATWLRAYDLGLAVYSAVPATIAAIPLYAVVWVYWIIAFAAVCVAFGVWLQAFVGVALLIGLGPLFAGLWLFPWTRGWFQGWLNTTAAHIVLQVLVVGLLALMVGTTSTMLREIAALAPPAPAAPPSAGSILRQYIPGSAAQMTGANEALQIAGLFGAAVVYAMMGFLAYRLNGVANSITHGFSGGAATLGRSAMSWGGTILGYGGGVARRAAGSGGGGGGSPPPRRVAAAPGSSLSNP